MPLDPAPLAELAAQFMDGLEAEYGDEATLLRFGIVAELEIEDEQGYVEARTPEGYELTEAVGLFTRGIDAMLNGED